MLRFFYIPCLVFLFLQPLLVFFFRQVPRNILNEPY